MLFVFRNSLRDVIVVGNGTQHLLNWRQIPIHVLERSMSKKQHGNAHVKMMKLGGQGVRRAVRSNDSEEQGKRRTPNPKLNIPGAKKRSDMLDIKNTDWSSVYVAAASYDPNIIPLHIRMGRPRYRRLGDVPPDQHGNIELLKIPNFFHLTPPAIKKHCEALKEFCVPWPKNSINRPVRITTINFLYAGPSIRHPDSRKVKLQVYLKDLNLEGPAHRKFTLLAGNRYNPNNDELTLVTDKCPTRQQNKEYAYFLLSALYYESIKTEPWEKEAENETEKKIDEEVENVRKELNKEYRTKNYRDKKQRFYRIINDKLIRYNKTGHPFVHELPKYGIRGGLTKEELQLAKDEWAKIQKNLPDESTFDLPYRPSSRSEFDIHK